MPRFLAPVLLVALVASALTLTLIGVHSAPIGPPRVKLAVLVVFDQMRGDYPVRWQKLYGTDGFERMKRDGVWFANCHYPYGTTTTGPGHASILSGTCGDRHGIVNNNWFEGGRLVYCAASERYNLVPSEGNSRGNLKEAGNPDRMLAATVADALKTQRRGAKVFGLSLKDRSAILPTGKHPDGAYWFTGQFVTSSYYRDRVHPWVERFNESKAADAWFGKDWTRFRTDIDYAAFSGPDDFPGEGKGIEVKDGPAKGWSQKVTFPHPNTGASSKPGKDYYEALANSPFGNELLLQFAKECITAEHLGEDAVPDLIVLSFSSNDLIGHTWGPDSQEMLDVTLRSDAIIADLLKFLDAKVGPDQYLLGITADHGICPLPEASRAKGLDAKRVAPASLAKAIDEHLTEKFSTPGSNTKSTVWVESFTGSFPWVYFNPKALSTAKKTREQAAAETAAFLRKHPDVGRVFTRQELEGRFPPMDVVGNRAKRSFHPGRSGDVYVVLKEWYIPYPQLSTGTTHGAPYDYDTHVPLMLIGPGLTGGEQNQRTTPQAMAQIFSKWLGIRPPKQAEFPLPSVLEGK
ncbi:MAG: alkaline phosphatase family protein [Gemmataceae bacterium]